jgi:hypothetical protein
MLELKYEMTFAERIEGPLGAITGSPPRLCWQVPEATLAGPRIQSVWHHRLHELDVGGRPTGASLRLPRWIGTMRSMRYPTGSPIRRITPINRTRHRDITP